MHKIDCKNCPCLQEDSCEETYQLIENMETCPEGTTPVKVGEKVAFVDPDHLVSSGIYTIAGMPNDEILSLSNGTTETEAYYYECTVIDFTSHLTLDKNS